MLWLQMYALLSAVWIGTDLVEKREPWMRTDDAGNLGESQIAIEPWIAKLCTWRQEAPACLSRCDLHSAHL